MDNRERWRSKVRERLIETTNELNRALRGENLEELEPTLKRLGRKGKTAHWYAKLKQDQVLPNLDGKTIGSVIEMLFVAVLETFTLAGLNTPPDYDLKSIQKILSVRPIALGVLFAADTWVEEYHKDFARSPNENEWQRLLKSPLNGRIGMSFALQWRYKFSRIFSHKK